MKRLVLLLSQGKDIDVYLERMTTAGLRNCSLIRGLGPY
jgi:hypothetical protein